MGLSNLTIADLKSLAVEVKNEIGSRQQDELKKARDKILAIAQSVGVPLSDLLDVKTNKNEKSPKVVAAKFRHPDDASKVWSGRGRKPAWIVDLEQSDKIDSARL
jgi:DNA-binding protein H-NS